MPSRFRWNSSRAPHVLDEMPDNRFVTRPDGTETAIVPDGSRNITPMMLQWGATTLRRRRSRCIRGYFSKRFAVAENRASQRIIAMAAATTV